MCKRINHDDIDDDADPGIDDFDCDSSGGVGVGMGGGDLFQAR